MQNDAMNEGGPSADRGSIRSSSGWQLARIWSPDVVTALIR